MRPPAAYWGYGADIERKLLILDLDETLIYSVESPLEAAPDFPCFQYCVYKRPGVDAFLQFVQAHFAVAVWTAASEGYARCIVSHLFPPDYPLAFMWGRNRCVHRRNPETDEDDYLKDLRKVKRKGYRLASIIVVDDSPENLARNYGNLVRVTPFLGHPADVELPALAAYLRYLHGVEDIRAVEKRSWQHRFSPPLR